MNLQTIEDAIRDGRVLTIRYHGGSKPGAVREVLPVGLKEGVLRARCMASKRTKSFRLDRMEIDVGGEMEAPPAEQWAPPKEIGSLRELLEIHGADLESLGWHIRCDEGGLRLCRFFKNGKPRKTFDVAVLFEAARLAEIIEDGEVVGTEMVSRKRPWIVRAKGETPRTYGSLNKAYGVFLQWAREMAPGASG